MRLVFSSDSVKLLFDSDRKEFWRFLGSGRGVESVSMNSDNGRSLLWSVYTAGKLGAGWVGSAEDWEALRFRMFAPRVLWGTRSDDFLQLGLLGGEWRFQAAKSTGVDLLDLDNPAHFTLANQAFEAWASRGNWRGSSWDAEQLEAVLSAYADKPLQVA